MALGPGIAAGFEFMRRMGIYPTETDTTTLGIFLGVGMVIGIICLSAVWAEKRK